MRKWFELHKWEIVRMHTKSKVLVGSIKKGNSSTISLTVELFYIYAFELFPICAIRTIYTIPYIYVPWKASWNFLFWVKNCFLL